MENSIIKNLFNWKISKKNIPERLLPPLVTKCCGSARWSHAFSYNEKKGVDICYDCMSAKPDNIRFMTFEDYNKLNSYFQVNEDEFYSMFLKPKML